MLESVSLVHQSAAARTQSEHWLAARIRLEHQSAAAHTRSEHWLAVRIPWVRLSGSWLARLSGHRSVV